MGGYVSNDDHQGSLVGSWVYPRGGWYVQGVDMSGVGYAWEGACVYQEVGWVSQVPWYTNPPCPGV